MFKYYPLTLSNVDDCMIKIDLVGENIVGQLYRLKNKNTEPNDVDNRYHAISFFAKEVKQSDHPNLDFAQWVNLFCDFYEAGRK